MNIKKFIIIFFLNTSMRGDFYDTLSNLGRSTINSIPIVFCKIIPDALKSKPVMVSALCALGYLSFREKKSIPFLRVMNNIKELNNKKRISLIFQKIQVMNKKCLCLLTIGKFSQENSDEKYNELKGIAEALKEEELMNLFYPKEDILEEEAYKSLLTECLLKEIAEEIEKKETVSIFDKKTLVLYLKYYLKLMPNILELSLLLSIFVLLKK